MNSNSINDKNKPLDAPSIELMGTPTIRDWDTNIQKLIIDLVDGQQKLAELDKLMESDDPKFRKKVEMEMVDLMGDMMRKLSESTNSIIDRVLMELKYN
jgi:hypothetical protein